MSTASTDLLSRLMDDLNHLEAYAQNKQASSKEAQTAISNWTSQLEKYLVQPDTCDDREKFQQLSRKISRIDPNYKFSGPLLQNICSLMNRSFPVAPSSSLFTLENIWETAANLVKSCLYIPNTLQGVFLDGQSEWKQQKYKLVLNAILKAFSTDTLIPLELKSLYENLKAIEIKSPLEKMAFDCICPLIEPSDNPGAQYRQFIDALRTASRQSEFIQQIELALAGKPNDPYAACILRACYYRFSEVYLYDFCENLIEMMLKEGMRTLHPDCHEPLPDVFDLPLDQQFKAIQAVSLSFKEPLSWSLIQRSSAFTNICYDPQRKSNIPYILCSIIPHSNHPLKIIRMGTPTISSSSITPEFKLFLTSCSLREKKFLYISFQSENWHVEASRNQLLKPLAQEFPHRFFLVILSKDTPFFHQTGLHGIPYQTAEIFINDFLAQLYSNQTGFYFEASWLENLGFRDRLTACLQEVHQDIFNEERILSRQQRLDFIEIAYARLLLEIIDYLKLEHRCLIDFLCVACRDCNDRAVITLALLTALSLHYLGKYHTPQFHRMLQVFIHAPKMLVIKEEMNLRRERLISALNTLAQPEVMIHLRLRQQYSQIVKDLILL